MDTERSREGDLEGDRLRERSLRGLLDLLRPGLPSVSSCGMNTFSRSMRYVVR